MKEIINEQEVKKFNYYGNIFSIHFLILIISAAPLFIWLEQYAFNTFRGVVCNYNVLGIESWKNQERKWYTDLQGDSCIYRGKETGWTRQSGGNRKASIPKCIKSYHQCCCYGGDLFFDWIVDAHFLELSGFFQTVIVELT